MTSSSILILVAAVLLGLIAFSQQQQPSSWPQYGHDAQSTFRSPYQPPSEALATWSTALNHTYDFNSHLLINAEQHELVFIGWNYTKNDTARTRSCDVLCVSLLDGSIMRRFHFKEKDAKYIIAMNDPVLFDSDHIIVGIYTVLPGRDFRMGVASINLNTGNMEWTFQPDFVSDRYDNHVDGITVIDGGKTVLFTVQNGPRIKYIAVPYGTSAAKWILDFSNPAIYPGTSVPTVDPVSGNVILVNRNTNKIVRVDARNGAILANATMPNANITVQPTIGKVTLGQGVSKNLMFTGAQDKIGDKWVLAFNKDTGALAWQTQFETIARGFLYWYCSPVIVADDGASLYHACVDSNNTVHQVFSFDAMSGKQKWTSPQLHNMCSLAQLSTSGHITVTCLSKYVYVIDPSNGNVISEEERTHNTDIVSLDGSNNIYTCGSMFNEDYVRYNFVCEKKPIQ